jgi:hypothetical protein
MPQRSAISCSTNTATNGRVRLHSVPTNGLQVCMLPSQGVIPQSGVFFYSLVSGSTTEPHSCSRRRASARVCIWYTRDSEILITCPISLKVSPS